MRYTFRLGEMKVLERGFYCVYFFLPSLVMQLIVIVQLIDERWAISFLIIMVHSKTKMNE